MSKRIKLKVQGPENKVFGLSYGLSRGTHFASHDRGDETIPAPHMLKSLKPCPDKVIMRVQAGKIEDGPEIEKPDWKTLPTYRPEFSKIIRDGKVVELSIPLENLDDFKTIFVGRLGKQLGIEEVTLVDGHEIVEHVIRTIERYREKLDKAYIEQRPIIERGYSRKGGKGIEMLFKLLNQAVRIQRLIYFGLGINPFGRGIDIADEVSTEFTPPKMALIIPKEFTSVSGAAGVIELYGPDFDESSLSISSNPFYENQKNMWVFPWQSDAEMIGLGKEVLISFASASK